MNEGGPHFSPADREQSDIAAKRPTSEMFSSAPEIKKSKGSDGGTTVPVTQRPNADRQVPIFEKVR